MTVQARRGLVPLEIAAVIVVALAPWPAGLPPVLPLLVCASIARWVRGRAWTEVLAGGPFAAGVGAVAGAAALGLALVVGGPVVEVLSQRAVEWSMFPSVRGNPGQVWLVLVAVVLAAVAAELALRGWLVERVLELSPGAPVLPVLVGAIAEMIVMPGELAVRLGAGLCGLGLGAMYVAGGRSVLAPVLARGVFAGGAVVLEALRVIG